jgi:hypothetical protein
VSELVDIVDEAGAVVGVRERAELRDGEDRWRIVVLVVISELRDRVLLVQRAWDKKHDPGRWASPVAGTAASGESYSQATDASNRARIYEITPAASGQVTLTVGTGTQTLYRVYVDANLDAQNSFGNICIHRFRDDEQIRCDSADSDPTPVGALRGIAGNTGAPSTSTPGGESSSGIDLSKVPTQRLLDELRRRIDG